MLDIEADLRPSGELASTDALSLNLDEQAYTRVKSMIANGILAAGERVVPEQLAREMAISRTPMLSALKRLFQEGLVDWQSRRGIYIRRLSKLELAQIFELREVMEGLVARRAATALEPSQLEQLASMFDGIDIEETPQNRRNYLQLDYRFHAGLLDAANSGPLTQAVQALNIMVAAFSGGLIRTIREGMEEHAEIFAALRERDPDRAESAMRLHIGRSVHRLYEEVEAEGDASRATMLGNANREFAQRPLKAAAATPQRAHKRPRP